MKHEALLNSLLAQPTPVTEDQRKAAEEFGLAENLAARLRGHNLAQLRADAEALAGEVKEQAEADVPDHVRLARQAIASANSNPNVAEMQALFGQAPEEDAD